MANNSEKIPHFYRVGRPGESWTTGDKAQWRAVIEPLRSYKDEVLNVVEMLKGKFDVEQYGALSNDPERYPLFALKSKNWNSEKASVLITGGVHGYETSGVQGALLFLQTKAEKYGEYFNILCLPCVSPWGYERVQRWNANAVDPNRSFYPDSTCEEAAFVINLLNSLGENHMFKMHLDLHETTDTDESEFRPAKASRDGLAFEPGIIPDGYYLIGDNGEIQAEWHTAIIAAVKQVTHIAPADENGCLVGEPISQEGVITYPSGELNLCRGVTGAPFAATTEVYPDSTNVTDEECNRAQVAAVVGALDFVLTH
uniref:Peptidase M14 domain-containing protein n=1 Tax=Fibrocapsa japonica TaxID=94617 RepID=A0A7S2Y103_9STRA|mmetsp:Transcript_7841/g.11950  ORF Transcript_7841/g.11950 Transcript_7841/m.11950 type:complete len:313 (+) Transcript_7841:66-1004(+)|eukprot:CAMPEP_0113947760 /NCGR_PEP_ID=MMETSP1339-20121228/66489_1 /TAXON_ID=94617 /ORGANISM="Fibrocapsa japonica" /LENGTH=312 /DNA_ID=CAMNT_0000954477 /DNA_START=66 /DNA_END=1004 /DNA_ORIENTATION=+ /assembly_acc=CAM_ASM_000762